MKILCPQGSNYRVWRQRTSEEGWQLIGTIPDNQVKSYTDTSAGQGTRWYVVDREQNGASTPNTNVKVIQIGTAPTTVVDLLGTGYTAKAQILSADELRVEKKKVQTEVLKKYLTPIFFFIDSMVDLYVFYIATL
jgi:hypothetical protein